jgi:5-oxoprolinase (ATP-hydrolysing)
VEKTAFGYLKVANEVMCRPVRALTESKGQDPSKFELAVFGGAGAQHACSIASNLKIKKIFIHKYSPILSAFGIFLADITKRDVQYLNQTLESLDEKVLFSQIQKLSVEGKQYFEERSDSMQGILTQKITMVLKYQGSEALINLGFQYSGQNDSFLNKENLNSKFSEKHKKSFGFLINGKQIVIQRVFVDTFLQREDIENVLKLRENKKTDSESKVLELKA